MGPAAGAERGGTMLLHLDPELLAPRCAPPARPHPLQGCDGGRCATPPHQESRRWGGGGGLARARAHAPCTLATAQPFRTPPAAAGSTSAMRPRRSRATWGQGDARPPCPSRVHILNSHTHGTWAVPCAQVQARCDVQNAHRPRVARRAIWGGEVGADFRRAAAGRVAAARHHPQQRPRRPPDAAQTPRGPLPCAPPHGPVAARVAVRFGLWWARGARRARML